MSAASAGRFESQSAALASAQRSTSGRGRRSRVRSGGDFVSLPVGEDVELSVHLGP